MAKFGIKANRLRGDLFGGITAGVVALPLALAFGVQSGMGAIAGLYGAIACGIFAAIFGGTPSQVSGPTGPMTVISALVISSAISITGSLEAGMWIIIASFLLAGILQIVFGFLKVGKYVKYIPYPVLSGFMSGIGVIIILYQIFPFFGLESKESTIDIILSLGEIFRNLSWPDLIAGSLTISIIYLFPKISKLVPSPLVALVLGSLVCLIAGVDIAKIGEIPRGIPSLKLGVLADVKFGYWDLILEFGFTLAALGVIDSLLTSIIADNLTKVKHNSNKELIGQGIGNIIAAMIGGLPGAGATMRTVVNIKSGGRTRISGLVHGILLLAILLGLGPLASVIPLSVLAGILITVGIAIIDYQGLRHLLFIPRTDALIFVTVFLITVFGNLLFAVAIGMVLASVLFMKKTSDIVDQQTYLTDISSYQNKDLWVNEKIVFMEYKDKIYIKKLNGPLFFGYTSRFQEILRGLPKRVEFVILNLNRVPYIDQSGVYALRESIIDLHKKQIEVVITNIQEQPYTLIKKMKIIPDLIPLSQVFEDIKECSEWLNWRLKARMNEKLDDTRE